MRWKVIGLVVFALIVTVFTLINTTSVTMNFLFVKATVNLVLVILISVLLGMVLMAILWSLHVWKLRGAAEGLRTRIRELEKEREQVTPVETNASDRASEPSKSNGTT